MATDRGWEKFCHFHAYTCIITATYYMLYHVCLASLIHTVVFHWFPPLESRQTSLLLFMLWILSQRTFWMCVENTWCAGGCIFELPNFSKDYNIGREFNLYRFILRVLYTNLPKTIHLIINCQLMNHYQVFPHWTSNSLYMALHHLYMALCKSTSFRENNFLFQYRIFIRHLIQNSKA